MKSERIVPGVYRVLAGFVNSYAIEAEEGLVLVDCGTPKHPGRIAEGVAFLGRQAAEVTDILITHHHIDHAGGLATLTQLMGAMVYAHAADARIVRGEKRPPGADLSTWVARILGPRLPPPAPPAAVHTEIVDGQLLPLAGGIRVVNTPGHTLGHCAFLLERDGGVLLVGDAAVNLANRIRLPLPMVLNEDRAAVVRSFRALTHLDFEAAVFGHGTPITTGAAERFRQAAHRWRCSGSSSGLIGASSTSEPEGRA